ncbi:MAG TPA: asparagine synthase (glutamine-hydrolyzing), partial [Candidatus Limnocylindrales bacterium]|nr:asparagine synthase (glutamine-hydrolyzing) [Candidatus Limnocylindrales bacterium]
AVVNGEFYGSAPLRDRLLRGGHAFRGASDSEVLVHLWEEMGPEALQQLTGMFALAVFDTKARVLLLARDRMGKKPLYWHDDGSRIVFASELKALLLHPGVPRDVDESAVVESLTFGYITSPRSIWKGVNKLPPGHFILCDSSGPRTKRYWTPPAEGPRPESGQAAAEELRREIEDAVRTRLVADVPIGALLSGGIDSSCVAAVMSAQRGTPISTFCVGVEGTTDQDILHARLVASQIGSDHHEYWIGPGSLALLPRLVWALDEPFFDPSILPSYHVARLARERVTVVLSGDGGDEMFGGYDTYRKAMRHAAADWVPWPGRNLVASAARAFRLGGNLGERMRQWDRDLLQRHLWNMSLFHAEDFEGLLAPGLAEAVASSPIPLARRPRRNGEGIAGLLAYDAETYLPDDVLAKVDRMSMLNSLEVRTPLLDQRIVEFSARLPISMKLHQGVTKWVLREAVKGILPEPVLQRRKRGFGVPLYRWMDQGLRALASEILLDGRCARRGWLDPKGLAALLGPGPQPGRRAHQVFALTCLELWARTYVDRPREDLVSPMDGPLELHPAVSVEQVA